jgi:hypothetical protein
MQKDKSKKYAFIIENTITVPNSKLEILEESRRNGTSKAVFRSRLQESNVKNQNGRIYETTVCENIVKQLSPRANARNLLCEIDHPLVGDPATMKRRAAITEIKNCGAVIRNIHFSNGQIIGEMETLSGFRGPDLAKLILDDKVDIGWSLRALGSVQTLSDGTIKVLNEIRPITYDVVSTPSHANAKILEFLPESDMSFLNAGPSVLTEGLDDFLMKEEITICENNQCVKLFLEDYIQDNFRKVIGKGIRFFI